MYNARQLITYFANLAHNMSNLFKIIIALACSVVFFSIINPTNAQEVGKINCLEGDKISRKQYKQENSLWIMTSQLNEIGAYEDYLKAYPCGIYVQSAKTMLNSLRQRNSNSSTGTGNTQQADDLLKNLSPSDSGVPLVTEPEESIFRILTSHDAVFEAQSLMYNLNLDFGALDGKTGPKTSRAVKSVEKFFGWPETGNITHKLINQLKLQKLPTSWASLAFTGRGKHGSSSNRKTRTQSERDALRKCKRRTRDSCKMITVANGSCVALYKTYRKVRIRKTRRRTTYQNQWNAFSSGQKTLKKAKKAARANCVNSRRGNSKRCKYVFSICS